MKAIKRGQVWVDKKNGNRVFVHSKHHDIIFNCILVESGTSHKMTPRTLNKYYALEKDYVKESKAKSLQIVPVVQEARVD